MDYKKNTSHVVIQFDDKTIDGKHCIDLVPISWTYIKESKLYCKYPSKKEYALIDKMNKSLSDPKKSWKGFGISIMTEARSYEQGVRRMTLAFSNSVIHSSAVEEPNSSEDECNPKELSGNDLQKHLKDISSFIKLNPTITEHKANYDKDQCDASSSEISSASEKKKILTKKKSLKKSIWSDHYLDGQLHSDNESSESSSMSTERQLLLTGIKPSKKMVRSSHKSDEDNIHSDASISSLMSTGKINLLRKKSSKKAQSYEKLNFATEKRLVDATYAPNKKHCPTCGRSDNAVTVTKSDLESLKRSIEYRIKEEGKITRALIEVPNKTTDIEKILNDNMIMDLPKTTLESFKDFERQLESDIELVKKLKCFIVLNMKTSSKVSDNLTAVIPKIICKEVQLMYSAFGREMNGQKKLNFSSTITYKYLLEALITKHEGVKGKDISSILSRWFSGAKDREGGKKLRMKND
ncbi:uncharacterized protein LOC132945181 isoform X2 [Metopolophium dirhodum]|uniref:uncharacterized protein LOC132945181 isoform X2 n=1 Tax=Metopolophium dirhodum TaxID=44670 RepID=UPI0029902D6F|nr:uncharacterized protein LOC132945181 isoform X2 [Metopolophium dirhodum]